MGDPRSASTSRLVAALLVASLGLPVAGRAQEIFPSTQSANLSTTTTLPRAGNWLFEISHRFIPPMSSGVDDLWGFDGPIYYRLALSWAPTDRSLLTVQRTNLDDNLELNGKARLASGGSERMAFEVGLMTGIAWNTDPVDTGGDDQAEDNESQFYVQALIDARLGDRVAIGVVPTYLRNPRIRDAEPANAFALGLHGQVRLGGGPVSLLGEWIFSEARPDMEYDSGSFGIEIATRGHSFKIVVTNQPRVNPTQFLAGSPDPFEADELRLGFNITRVLPF